MTIVIWKKEDNKIVLWADSQVTFWFHKWKTDKLFESKYIIFWWAWLHSESLALQDFLEDYKLEINNKKDLFIAMTNFYIHLKTIWMIDSRAENDKEVANHFVIVLKPTWQLFRYVSWSLTEVDDYAVLWSWMYTWLAIMEHWWTVKEAIEMACKQNLYCWWDINILDINIVEKDIEEKKWFFKRLFS